MVLWCGANLGGLLPKNMLANCQIHQFPTAKDLYCMVYMYLIVSYIFLLVKGLVATGVLSLYSAAVNFIR